MYRYLASLLFMLILPVLICAQEESLPLTQAVSDSLAQTREREILSEYGFRDSNTLREVAERLSIGNIPKWKNFLGIEPANTKLDDMTLRRLDITPYRALLAQQYSIYGYTELSTLTEIAATLSIPLKKLKAMLGNEDPLDKSWDNMSLQALGFVPDDIQVQAAEFNEHIVLYGSSITLVGMLVVFCALLITSIIIGQLIHLNREPKRPDTIKMNSSGKVTAASKGMSRSIIVAAVTALHMHKQEIEEHRKMVLTIRRTPTNQWRASGVLSMPNREITARRR